MFKTRRMGGTELAILATVWTTVVWIGADMYLPALPTLTQTFPVSDAVVNMTLLAFAAAMPVGSLMGGPLTDRLGRRWPTFAGGLLYVLANLACAVAPDVWFLIVMRAVAGLGGGVVGASTLAIIKDCLEGPQLDRAITITQSFAAVGPIAAPFLGSLMIDLAGWRGIFALLAVLAALCLGWFMQLGETLPPARRANVKVAYALSLVWNVGRNPSFMLLLLALASPALSWGVFCTLCSYAFIDFFGLSNFVYSVFYGLTAVVSMIGPFVFLWLHKRVRDRTLVRIVLCLLLASGLLVVFLGTLSPVAYFLASLPFFLAESMARPYTFLALLRAADNAGSASALITFVMGILIALGTPVASLPIWANPVVGTGWPFVMSAVVSFVLLAMLLHVVRSDILDKQDEVE